MKAKMKEQTKVKLIIILCAVLLGVLTICILIANGEIIDVTYHIGGYTIKVHMFEAIIQEYNGNKTEIRIPNTFIFSKVSAIEDGAFDKDTIKSIYIPANVSEFTGNSFTHAVDTIEVSDKNEYFYSENNNIYAKTNHYVSKTHTNRAYTIDYDKGDLIYGTQGDIPSDTHYILYGAFKNCTQLTTIEIPDTIKGVFSDAFVGCTNLVSIKGCLNNIISICKNCDSKSYNVIVTDNKARLTEIGPETFKDCNGMTSITIPNSVESIGYWAFMNCSNLSSIHLPNNLKSIAEGLFDGCSELTSIDIPATVHKIYANAFANCSKLTTINYGGSKEQWNALIKESPKSWDAHTSNFTVYCTDGTIKKGA